MRVAPAFLVPMVALAACSSSKNASEDPPPLPAPSRQDDARDAGEAGDDAATDAADSGTPAVVYIGRFAALGTSAVTAWPGSRIVARFEGSSVSGTFSQTAGSDGDGTYVNVTIDDGTPAVR